MSLCPCSSGLSALSWLDGEDTCVECRPEVAREPIPTLAVGRPPLVRLAELAAIQRETPALPAPVAVEGLNPVPVGAETTEPPSEPLRAIKPPPTTLHLDPQTADEELAAADQLGAAMLRPLLAFGPLQFEPVSSFQQDKVAFQMSMLAEARLRAAVQPLVMVTDDGHPAGQTTPPLARSRWSRAWARLLRRSA